ncbi:helix-turn-helix domain-containing protein [Aurantimicrobium minutum]|uniref:helix-turn-helix domain-containing protein n=1 Tax=Aurantimicrobium minutum TaxID=708131 RepID=UPI00248D4ACF|nr:helix-turn-helix domain-containing protein [Aurantimicrobium minutum]
MANSKQTRAERVIQNDLAIYTALEELISEIGWDAVTVSGVAKKAGVTVGAIYARAENISELANNLWQRSLEITIWNYFNSISVAARSGNPQKLIDVSKVHENSISLIKVGLELIVASVFDDELNEVIGESFSGLLKKQLGISHDSQLSGQRQAALFLVTSFLVGRVLAQFAGAELSPLSQEEAQTLAGFYEAPEAEHLPLNILHVEFIRNSESNDLLIEKSTLNSITKWGYRKATFARIARQAGVTPGALITGHSSKLELVAHSAEALLFSPQQVWQPFEEQIPKYGSPEIRTEFLFEYLKPQNLDNWKLNIELARIAGISPELRQFKTPGDALQRTHLAVMLLAIFLPDLHNLPFKGCFKVGATT